MKKIRQHFQRKLKESGAGITVDQWVVLDKLRKNDGASQYEIANSTFKDAPTVTRIIDLICAKGLAERRVDNGDRRRYNIYLTEAGKEKVRQVLPLVQEIRQKGWVGLSEEDYSNLIRILETIYHNYE